MARSKKDGKRARGIQGKKGFLYIISHNHIIKDGETVNEKVWISTGLKDIPENIKAASEMREKLRNCRKDGVTTDRNVSVADYAEMFLEKKRREVSERTYAAYYYRGKQIIEYFGDLKIRDMNKKMIESFLDDLFKKHQMQPRTVKDIKVFLGGMVDRAVIDGIIPHNPIKDVTINKSLSDMYSKEKNSDDDFFSHDEAQLFLKKTEDHDLHELFYITIFFGLRREEVLGLRWSAIDFRNKKMTINHTVAKGLKVIRTNTTKTKASARQYPLNDENLEVFRKLQSKEADNRKKFGNCYHENEYIFKHDDGTPYYPDYPTKAFARIIKQIPELPQSITFHGLRVSCVSMLIHQGVDVKRIQKWVGHADIDTTLRIYAKVKDKESKLEVSEAMSSLITL